MGEEQEGDISPGQYSDCPYKCSPCDWQYVFELNARRADQLYCITACDASTSSKPLQFAEQEVLNDICSLQARQSQAQFLLNCSPQGCCLLTLLGWLERRSAGGHNHREAVLLSTAVGLLTSACTSVFPKAQNDLPEIESSSVWWWYRSFCSLHVFLRWIHVKTNPVAIKIRKKCRACNKNVRPACSYLRGKSHCVYWRWGLWERF